MRVINNVIATKEYDKFKTVNQNRVITTNIKLMEEIKENGILVPVLVNEDYEIIDGQHRIYYAKELGVEVPHIVIKGAGKKEIISINTVSKNWTLMDYIKSYADGGSSEYRRLLSLIEEYSIVNVSAMCALAFNTTDSSRPQQKVRMGKLEFVSYDVLVEFLDLYSDLINSTELPTSQGLIFSMYSLFRLEKFVPDRIYSRSGILIKRLAGINQQGETTRILLDVYNHSLRRNSNTEIKYHYGSKGNVEFFENPRVDLIGLPGTSSTIYRGSIS